MSTYADMQEAHYSTPLERAASESYRNHYLAPVAAAKKDLLGECLRRLQDMVDDWGQLGDADLEEMQAILAQVKEISR